MWLFQCKAPSAGTFLNPHGLYCVQLATMRKTAWIWFLGCAAWLVNGLLNLRLHSMAQARLAFAIATVFLAAGFFFRNQKT